ncbi:hypothetical protein DPMN_135825 [Dreissena polymorpha]|uniref:Uncharacterized protein n=1 Tax=Dreissena polymorpha TaxID=45954 RepID=A0A9D4G4N0_DREPO|nr:hypothetical protein DPMN_135825 [Dreissena polymorpha]
MIGVDKYIDLVVERQTSYVLYTSHTQTRALEYAKRDMSSAPANRPLKIDSRIMKDESLGDSVHRYAAVNSLVLDNWIGKGSRPACLVTLPGQEIPRLLMNHGSSRQDYGDAHTGLELRWQHIG